MRKLAKIAVIVFFILQVIIAAISIFVLCVKDKILDLFSKKQEDDYGDSV